MNIPRKENISPTLIVKWLKQKLSVTHSQGFVVGLSGGIDSAVVSVLVKKSARQNHLCLIMPCGKISKSDMKDALYVVKKFHLNYALVDLTPVYSLLVKILSAISLPEFLKNITTDNKLSLANLKPRLRMMTLYYFANRLNYMVVGTGNKSELSVGYFTKYGDGGADLLPLGGLYKSQVVALARELNIPPSIIGKPPSAGLWEGQTDEGEMGVTYDFIEKVIRLLPVRKNDSKTPSEIKPSDIRKQGMDIRLIKKVIAMYNNSEHKRRTPEIFNPQEKF